MIFSQFSPVPVINTSDIPVSEPKVEEMVVREERKEYEDIESVEEYVRNYFSDKPILAEIARCESHFRQTDGRGNVLRGNVNSLDVGVMQINEWYHGDTSQKLGHDIYSINGNLDYALYLYEKEGARPWLASSKCWSHFSEKELARR